MSARCRLARTSFTPEKEGLPRVTIIARAALVSARRFFTSAVSAEGARASARSLAAELTALSESCSSMAGSSSVAQDFSYCCVIFRILNADRKSTRLNSSHL